MRLGRDRESLFEARRPWDGYLSHPEPARGEVPESLRLQLEPAIGGVQVTRPRRERLLVVSAATEVLEAGFLAHRDEAMPFAAVLPLARVH